MCTYHKCSCVLSTTGISKHQSGNHKMKLLSCGVLSQVFFFMCLDQQVCFQRATSTKLYRAVCILSHVCFCALSTSAFQSTNQTTSQLFRLHTSRLSQIPLATLARVLASKGAMTRRSACRRSSMCKTGSSLVFHACGNKTENK